MKLLIILSMLLYSCVEYTNENKNIQNMTQQDLTQKEFDDLMWRIKIHSDDHYLITAIKYPQNSHRFSRGGFKVDQRDDGLFKISWEKIKE